MTDTQPLDTKHSANRNVHIVSLDRRGNMILAPGAYGRNAALVSIAFLPLLLYLCHHFALDKGLWIAAILFPLFAAGGFMVGQIGYAKWGTRVVFDAKARKIIITGLRHTAKPEVPFDDVVAVQHLDVGIKDTPDVAWHSYQINLVLKDQTRYNLLDSGGPKQLNHIGKQMAKYLKVPFERNN